MELTLRQIEQATGGRLYGEDVRLSSVVIDSREAKAGALYVAIRGERFDGHDFCEAAVQNGAEAVVCEKEPRTNMPYVLVKDTRQALLDIAGLYRDTRKDVKLIAVTGSVGKTTTKEMTHAVLARKYNTLKTEGNLNNEIGMPKTLFRITPETQAAVIEMGMNHFGEIARMTAAAKPDAAIITNIGVSHIEFLGSRDGILKAKTEVINGMPVGAPLLVNGDNDKLKDFTDSRCRVVRFGIDAPHADIRAEDIVEENGTTRFTVRFNGSAQSVKIPLMGRHQVYNALAAFGAGLLFDVPPADIAEGLAAYTPAGMRQRIRQVNGITVIEDCYNASPDSQRAALNVLAETKASRRIAVLGDMLELGTYSEEAHRQVGAYAAQSGIDALYCCGTAAKAMAKAAEDAVPTAYFTNKDDLFAALSAALRPGDAVLFKASRGMAFEEVIQKLYGEWNEK